MGDNDDTVGPERVAGCGQRKGRGAVSNEDGRFEVLRHENADDGWGGHAAPPALATTVNVDHSKSIIAHNQSPDLPFDQSVNPYRGCEHGCIYCFARPTHAYLGLSPGLDFESQLFYKPDAVMLLRRALAAPGYRCRPLALGTNTDPYQPVDRRYRITRQLLELLRELRHPVSITTKSKLVERDLDVIGPMAADNLVHVSVSITTFDHSLARRLEPRATAPDRRLRTVTRLAEAGVPVNVSVSPIIPVLTDPELESIVAAAASAGAGSASYIFIRLPLEVKALFRQWLQIHYPARAGHVMSLIRQSRGGRDNDPRFGHRRRGQGAFAELIAKRFRLACRRHGISRELGELNCRLFRAGGGADQLPLF